MTFIRNFEIFQIINYIVIDIFLVEVVDTFCHIVRTIFFT